MKAARLIAVGWYHRFKMISRSPFEGIGQVISFALLHFFELQGHPHATLERS